jgi:hypothetical protein
MTDHLDLPPVEIDAPDVTPMLTNLGADRPVVIVPFPLRRLPDELLLHVFAQLPVINLLNLSLTARHLGSMA